MHHHRERRASHPRLWRGAVVAFVLLVACRPSAGAATCGNGLLEYPDESCDDGAANGSDQCCSATCQIVDSDGDGVCDRDDHFDTDFGFVVNGSAPRPRLRVSGLGRAPADVSFRFTAVTTAPTLPFDPASDGLGVSFRAQFIFPDLLDVTLPAGARWAAGSHSSWSYHDPTGSVGGIVGVQILRRTGGRLAWRIVGRHMTFGLVPADLTFSGQLRMMLTLAPATAPVAVAMHWRTPPGESPCGFDASAHALTCGGPPSGPRCTPGDPDDMVQCAARAAAHGQDVYYARFGTYFTGACSSLPVFAVVPGVVCLTTGGASGFVVSTVHPLMTFPLGCVWCPVALPDGHLQCPRAANPFSC